MPKPTRELEPSSPTADDNDLVVSAFMHIVSRSISVLVQPRLNPGLLRFA